MQSYYFAYFCLLLDDEISSMNYMQDLAVFRNVMPSTHTFSLHKGEAILLNQKYEEARQYPVVFSTDNFNIHDAKNEWIFVSHDNTRTLRYNGKFVLFCTRDYSKLTVFVSQKRYYHEEIQKWLMPRIPFSTCIRLACEAGAATHGGIPLHASLIEINGFGVLFLGPSGIGKSTQAMLWVDYQGADFINGDRPCLRRIDDVWFGFGMPWDGKDNIKKQKRVPIKALISLGHATMNNIRRLSEQESMILLLNQVIMPIWDDIAMSKLTPLMGKLICEIPFYHLKCLPNEEATRMTRDTIFQVLSE